MVQQKLLLKNVQPLDFSTKWLNELLDQFLNHLAVTRKIQKEFSRIVLRG